MTALLIIVLLCIGIAIIFNRIQEIKDWYFKPSSKKGEKKHG